MCSVCIQFESRGNTYVHVVHEVMSLNTRKLITPRFFEELKELKSSIINGNKVHTWPKVERQHANDNW